MAFTCTKAYNMLKETELLIAAETKSCEKLVNELKSYKEKASNSEYPGLYEGNLKMIRDLIGNRMKNIYRLKETKNNCKRILEGNEHIVVLSG